MTGIKRGKTLEQGGAVYNFTGPQGFGVANMADALYAVKKLVYDENKITMHDLKMALSTNYGKGLSSDDVAEMVSEVASAMKSAGQPVGEKEVAAILKTVVAATESEQVKANGERILKLIDAVPKFGNDIPEVDAFARDVAYTYTKPLEKYKIHVEVCSRRDYIQYQRMYRLADRQEPHQTDVWHICR